MKSRRKNKKKKAEIKVDEDMLYFYMDDIEVLFYFFQFFEIL